jgi:hypothetical protein
MRFVGAIVHWTVYSVFLKFGLWDVVERSGLWFQKFNDDTLLFKDLNFGINIFLVYIIKIIFA